MTATHRGPATGLGEPFGHYLLLAPLGAGAMGEVWRARDTHLDRVVALKRLQPDLTFPAAAARFRREARIAARLRHPHIVRVHSSGTIEGRLYLDMELIEGPDLRAVLQTEAPLELTRVLHVLDGVAAALDAAHALHRPVEERTVHRDVKPGNVLLEPGSPGHPERVYLADFGIARAVYGGTEITEQGLVAGTPDYIAPEVWAGGRADHRADVYSLAVMLFQMVTGQLPFPREDMRAVIAAHLSVPPPRPSDLVAGLPRGFDEVVARGLAKEADERYQRAGDLAAAARAAFGEPVTAGRGAPRPDPPPGPGDTRPDTHPEPEPTVQAEGRRYYLGSRQHIAGVVTAGLLIPAYLFNLLPLDATLPLYLVLLYALGAVVAGLLPRSR